MASVKDLRGAFVEDDGVVIPDAPGAMGPPPPKRAKRDGEEGDAPVDGAAKEWWEVDEEEEEYVSVKKRRDQKVSASAARLGHKLRVPADAPDGVPTDDPAVGPGAPAEPEQSNIRQFAPPKEKTSLLSRAAGLKARANAITPAQRLAEEEAEILRTINEKKALMSAKEISKDVQYTQSIETGWKPPRTFAR